MATGDFANLGYADTDGKEVDGKQEFLDNAPILITPQSDFIVDFNADGIGQPDLLAPGDPLTITLHASASGFPNIIVILTGTYTGTDSDGSVHFTVDSPDGVEVQNFSIYGGLTETYLQDFFDNNGSTRVTNDGDFPADPYPTTQNNILLACFAAGTLIATPSGERAVERLRIGDPVTTADGRAVPVKWIGRQTIHTLFAGDRGRPVRIAAGALGGSLPSTDLVLTAEHALILNGLAINAGALINDTTITLEPLRDLPERFTVYHVETEAHDIIRANGVPAETFVDYAGRRMFDNYSEYLALYGEDRTIPEMPLPRISAARLVPPAIRARVAA